MELKKVYQYLFLLAVMLAGLTGRTQNYPVNVTTTVTPPYSVYLSDYSDATSNSLQVILLLQELDRLDYRVKLRLTIEGQGVKLVTKPAYTPQPIILQGGIPTILTGYDLRSYLNPDNLEVSGITRQQLVQHGTLPEGFYTFKVEVLDYNRQLIVSNPGISNAWLVLNDPPLINLPINNDKVVATNPQNAMFNWTPLHTASPNWRKSLSRQKREGLTCDKQ